MTTIGTAAALAALAVIGARACWRGLAAYRRRQRARDEVESWAADQPTNWGDI